MTDPDSSTGPASSTGRLTRQQVSAATAGLGWRYLVGMLSTHVPVASLAEAGEVAGRIAAACADAGDSLRLDIRAGRLILTLYSVTSYATPREIALAGRISDLVRSLGLVTDPEVVSQPVDRSVQVVEVGIDALDIAAIRPFWKAILGYQDEIEPGSPEDPLVDPLGQWPSIWFQQMDAPRPQRNRIHFDVCVPHDEAQRRIQAVLAVGGRMVYDAEAPAFWVLADPEGNEACITTWQGRDPA